MSSTYNLENESELTFRSNMDYELFKKSGKVYVDGNVVDEKYYTSKDGSTIISFKDEFTNSLTEGEHSFKIALSGENKGEAETYFKIATNDIQDETSTEINEKEKNKSKVNNPKTGDNITIWVSLMVVSMVGIIVTIKNNKRKVTCKH